MRITAWRAAIYPSVETGVATLIDFATAAVLVHGRAAILAARTAGITVRDPHAPPHVTSLATRADHWRGARRRLITLLSPAISDPTVTEDLHAIRALLGDLTARGNLYIRLGAEPSGHQAMQPDQLAHAMRDAAGAFEAIAASNAITIRGLFTKGLLYTPGKLLTAEPTATRPDHVTTTFTRTAIPATQTHINNLLLSYGAVHSGYTKGIPDAFHLARETITDDLAPGL
jgi:hypothetical protein